MDRPNVIVIMSDQMKATASHLYGSTFCQTPSLERMANEGVLYKHAVTPHPLCAPCRISFWTSQFPHSHGGRRNQTLMPGDATHAFKLWKEAGYKCGLIGKNHCFEQQSDLDLFDVWCEISHGGLPGDATTKGMDWFRPIESINQAHTVRKNLPHDTPQFAYGTSDFTLQDYSTGLVAGQTVQFLEEFGNDPFALWVSIPDPHTPYECPEKYAIAPEDVDMPPWREDEFSDGTAAERNKVLHAMIGVEDDPIEDVQACVGVYHGMVRFLDDGVGQILDALDRLNLRENTIVIFCADHGDFSGEHGQIAKGGAFYDCLTRVPLIASWPGHIAAGVVDESCVNLIDIVPTVLQLQGIEVPRSMHGEGLPHATDAEPRDCAFSEYGAGGPAFTMAHLQQIEKPWGRKAVFASLQAREAEGRRKMVRTLEWKYVHDPMGDKDELYDLVNDPWELYNVIDDADHRAIVADLQLKLADWSIRLEDAKPVPLPESVDPA
jgi:arylsulfatase A-like enzyme